MIENQEELFNTIPEKTNCRVYELDEETKKRKQEIEKEWIEMKEKSNEKK